MTKDEIVGLTGYPADPVREPCRMSASVRLAAPCSAENARIAAVGDRDSRADVARCPKDSASIWAAGGYARIPVVRMTVIRASR
jgi:hypothetical protein